MKCFLFKQKKNIFILIILVDLSSLSEPSGNRNRGYIISQFLVLDIKFKITVHKIHVTLTYTGRFFYRWTVIISRKVFTFMKKYFYIISSRYKIKRFNIFCHYDFFKFSLFWPTEYSINISYDSETFFQSTCTIIQVLGYFSIDYN